MDSHRGTVDPVAFEQTLRALPEPLLVQVLDLSFEAANAEVRNEPYVTVSEDEIVHALGGLRQNLAEDEHDRLMNVLAGLEGANDEDACWGVRTLYNQIALASPGRMREILARAVVMP